jgi:Tfp pilus assembly protein PilF
MFEASATRYIGLAKAYAKIANHAKAIWALEQAVLQEKSKRTLSLLADAYAKNHDRQKALEVYRQVLEIDPTDARARKLVGVG